MRAAVIAAILLTVFAAQAQPVYKCTNAKGENSYQSMPCRVDESSSRRAHASNTMGFTPGVPNAPAGPGQRRVQVRYTTTSANEACDGAKAMRTAALGAAGAAAGNELRSKLDRDVQAACK